VVESKYEDSVNHLVIKSDMCANSMDKEPQFQKLWKKLPSSNTTLFRISTPLSAQVMSGEGRYRDVQKWSG
jgi:hypothetical protein